MLAVPSGSITNADLAGLKIERNEHLAMGSLISGGVFQMAKKACTFFCSYLAGAEGHSLKRLVQSHFRYSTKPLAHQTLRNRWIEQLAKLLLAYALICYVFRRAHLSNPKWFDTNNSLPIWISK